MSAPKTVDSVIADVRSRAHGRTRYVGAEPYDDEMLVDKIDQQQDEIAALLAAVNDAAAARWRAIDAMDLAKAEIDALREQRATLKAERDLAYAAIRALRWTALEEHGRFGISAEYAPVVRRAMEVKP